MALQLEDLALRLLKKERENGSIDPKVLTELLRGGKAANERRKQLVAVVEKHPVLSDRDVIFRNHAERYTKGLEKIHSFAKLVKEGGYSSSEDQRVLYDAIGERLPDHIHRIMFIPTIENQGTPEQRTKWLPLAKNYRIFGAYAQTELGHGSNVQGIETVATYDKETQEFTINSPTLTSRKWWPGGLAKTANHAIVHARLYLEGKDVGVQAFIVQIRSLEDHQPMPGIEVGDVGPKVGWDSIDNGYCVFRHVRVPRENMLKKYAKVLPDGTFVRPKSDKIVYLTMVQGRAEVMGELAAFMGAASTITTRFSAARVQGRSVNNTESRSETQVIDYQNQQYALFPLIALSFAAVFAHQDMINRLHATLRSLEEHDSSFPAHIVSLHAFSSGMKAWFGVETTNGIERCKRLCGGHGFANSSGLAHLLAEMALVNTGEGTFDVLSLQHGLFLLKAFQRAPKTVDTTTRSNSSSTDSATTFLTNVDRYLDPSLRCAVKQAEDFGSAQVLLEAFSARAARVLRELGADMAAAGNDANACKVLTSQASVVHTELMVMQCFAHGVESLPMEFREERAALATLCSFFGAWLLLRSLGDLRQDDYFSSAQAHMLHQHALSLLPKIRKNAVLLTDAWDFSDFELNSAIGRYDGDIYRALVERVKDEPLNKSQVPEGFDEFLKPLIGRL